VLINREPAPATLAQVYEALTDGRARRIDALLARFPAALRLRHPFAIALRAMQSISGGDVPSGVALLRRAIEHSDPIARQYFIDVLVPYLISVIDIAGAEDALDSAGEVVPELVPAFLAFRAVIAARAGRDKQSRDLGAEATRLGRVGDNLMIGARVLNRCSLAAFYREDYAEATERALEAARSYERLDSPRNAATVYSVLYVLAHEWAGDPDVARIWAERLTISGALANDLSLQNYGLIAQLDIAAESGDTRRLISVRTRLLANQLHEQYVERFTFVLAESLFSAWSGSFGRARVGIEGLADSNRGSMSESAVCEAMLALFAAAEWDIVSARRHAHRALGQTVHHEAHEPLFDTRRRRIARVLAACACTIIGEGTRGRRALSRTFDPDGYFANGDLIGGLDEAKASPLMRGYARLINVVAVAAAKNRPQLGLTQTEAQLLRALPDGKTIKAIASEFHKSPKTIERQVGSIYEKLHVSNRAQAIQRARELGL
jgi:DNA-binding CsgD family transcriptional regulator